MTTNKWADYLISAVRYNDKHTHIVKARVHSDNWDQIGSEIDYTRQEIISMIKKWITFVTIIKGNDGKWNEWQSVFIVTINNIEYIKTVSNTETVDNLEDLLEF